MTGQTRFPLIARFALDLTMVLYMSERRILFDQNVEIALLYGVDLFDLDRAGKYSDLLNVISQPNQWTVSSPN